MSAPRFVLVGFLLLPTLAPAAAPPPDRGIAADLPFTGEQLRKLLARDIQKDRARRLIAQDQYAKAIPLAQQVATLEGEVHGSDDPRLADTLEELLLPALLANGDLDEAARISRRALNLLKRRFGLTNSRLLERERITLMLDRVRKQPAEERRQVVRDLGNIMRIIWLVPRGELGQAGKLVEQLTRSLDRPGRKIDVFYEAYLRLTIAGFRVNVGDHAAAVPLARRVEEILHTEMGDEHVQVKALQAIYLRLLDQQAEVLEQGEKFAEAKKLRQEALTLATRTGGEKSLKAREANQALAHVRKLETLSAGERGQLAEASRQLEQARILRKQGKSDAALKVAERAVASRKAILDEKDRLISLAMNEVAIIEEERGRYPQAIQAYGGALAIHRAILGLEHPDTRVIANNLERTLEYLVRSRLDEERFPQARDAVRNLARHCTELHGKDSWQTRRAAWLAAHVERRAKLDTEQRRRFAEAARLYQQAIQARSQERNTEAIRLARDVEKIRRDLLTTEDLTHVTLMLDLAEVYLSTGDLTQVGTCAGAAVEQIRKQGGGGLDLATGLELLAVVASRTGHLARGEQLFAEASEILVKVVGEQSTQNGNLLWRQARVLQFTRQYVKADEVYRKVVDVMKVAAGELSAEHEQVVRELALLCRFRDDHAGAEKHFLELLALRKQSKGVNHPDYADTLNSLGYITLLSGQWERSRKYLEEARERYRKSVGEKDGRYAVVLHNLVNLHDVAGNTGKADTSLVEFRANRKHALGEDSVPYALAIMRLGMSYVTPGGMRAINSFQSAAEAARAGDLIQEAQTILCKKLPAGHVQVAMGWHNLGIAHRLGGRFALAEDALRKAIVIRRGKLGPRHAETLNSMNSLVVLLVQKADVGAALALSQEVVEGRRQTFSTSHPVYAQGLTNQGWVLHAMGDLVQAEQRYREGLRIIRASLGEGHPNQADVLDHLGRLYLARGDFGQAELCHLRVLQLRGAVLGTRSSQYGAALDGLARLYVRMRRIDLALPLAKEAADIRRSLGEDSLARADSLETLGLIHLQEGELDKAQVVLSRCLDIRQKSLGEAHQQVGTAQLNLAEVYQRRGQLREAEGLARKSLASAMARQQVLAGVQSERQQLALAESMRQRLDRHLSLVLRSKADVEGAYAPVLGWKGGIFTRQQQLRVRRATSGSEARNLLDQLETVTRQLASQALNTPGEADLARWKARIEELTEQRENLETRLTRASQEFRIQQKLARRTPADLLAAMPAGLALVDILEYRDSQPPSDGKGDLISTRRLAAFVLRKGQPVRVVDLGPSKAISGPLEQWRRLVQSGGAGKDVQVRGLELRRLVWEPLEKHLEGASTILVSPDGDLARLPLGALPGGKTGRYLVEERVIAILAVPQLLPDLLSTGGIREKPTLLVLGDVDFSLGTAAAPVMGETRWAAQTPGGKRPQWSALPGTQGEMKALETLFRRHHPKGSVETLAGSRATEATFRSLAPGYRWLHLATHGFFAPPQVRSALAGSEGQTRSVSRGAELASELVGYHPGLLSGLVLAGANRPVRPGQDDGILTALEVAELDLAKVELAVLSACETGLGQVAGGEGVLGLQRAFQVAGARTTVTSLWQVPDEATAALMERFYANLWEGKKSKLDALLSAQRDLLRTGTRHPGLARAMIRRDRVEPGTRLDHLPPFYWAAFVLSGDWR